MDIKDWAALIGAVTGPVGLTIALMVYFRDRARVTVLLSWDMKQTESSDDIAVVRISNIGRRPIYLSHAHIRLPKGADANVSHLVFPDNIQGVTLLEGSAPHLLVLNQRQLQMEKYAKIWWRLRATVIDAAGKHYHSDWPLERPSWASSSQAPKLAIYWNRFRNWVRKRALRT
jgi:hypothetical protein